MSRSIEGNDLVSFFDEGRDIGVEMPGSGLEAMGDEYFFPGKPFGQPPTATNRMTVLPEGKPLAFFKKRRALLFNPLLRGTK